LVAALMRWYMCLEHFKLSWFLMTMCFSDLTNPVIFFKPNHLPGSRAILAAPDIPPFITHVGQALNPGLREGWSRQ